MKISKWIPWITYIRQFQPLKIHFVLFVILYFTISFFIKQNKVETSSFIGLALLMAKIILVFASVIIVFSLLSVLLCYLWFIYKQKNAEEVIQIKMDVDAYKKNDLKIITQLPFALRPFLGYVKVKLMYDDKRLTEAYLIEKKQKGQWFFFQKGLQSTNDLYLPDYKEYHFSKAIIFFEDFLHLFSFAIAAPIKQQIQNLPKAFNQNTESPTPKKTEEEKIRIEQLRKVEGEFLNYKKFENSDDVRRIVWKIFAKNKELVVRIPEIMDPFSSHVYLYASFFNSQKIELLPTYHQAMLNFFKQWTWTIYSALAKKDLDIRFIHDQLTAKDPNNVLLNITLSAWHQDNNLVNYFKPNYASVLCIHSFTPLNDLEQILSSVDNQTTIYFVKLSAAFKSLYVFNWLMRIFFIGKKDPMASLNNKWPLHPLKFQTLNAEKKIIALLKQHDCNFEILS